MKASVNLSCHRMTSGASGLQLFLLHCYVTKAQLPGKPPACCGCSPANTSTCWTSVPQANSRSHGLAFHHYTVTTHHVLAHARSPRRSIHSKSKSPHWSNLQNTWRRQRRGHCDCALPGPPGLWKRALLDQVLDTTSEQQQIPQLRLELTLN